MYFLCCIFSYFRRYIPFRISYFASESGGYILITAAALIGILAILGGFAIDYSKTVTDRDRLYSAVDGAALFLSNDDYKDEADAKARALRYVKANFSYDLPDEELKNFSVSITDDTIEICADYRRQSFFNKLLPFENWDLNICSEVKRDFEALEIVMVLDNTGSMSWEAPGDSTSKMDVLKDSAKDLVEILYSSVKGTGTNFQGDSLLKIGLVPFAATVNVGQDKADASWIRNQNFKYTPNGEGRSVDDLFKALKTEWYGCVEARGNDYDLDDTPPSRGHEDTLWNKYFSPDEPDFAYIRDSLSYTGNEICTGNSDDNPDGHDYFNSYLYDFEKESLRCDDRNYEDRLLRDEKYSYDNSNLESNQANSAKNFNDPGERGPNNLCVEPITALTDDKNKILSALDDMSPRGPTIIPFGVVWGWRVLSPGVPFTQGRDYNDNVRKILILLTDGQNSVSSSKQHIYEGVYTGYGFTSEILQSDQGQDRNAIIKFLDEKTKTVCDNIKHASQKQDGNEIEIFTISFGFSDDSNEIQETKELLKSCASNEDNYFDAKDSEALQSAFNDIADKLIRARLSR